MALEDNQTDGFAMTIDEAARLKISLEEKIAELLLEFENKTSLAILDVSVKWDEDVQEFDVMVVAPV